MIGVPVPAVVVVEDDGGRSLHRFMSDRVEETVAQARAFVGLRLDAVDRIALAMDGYIPHEGKKWDALIVEAFDPSREMQMAVAQRYRVTGLLRKKAALVGSPIMLGA
jgi:hypothetical protein